MKNLCNIVNTKANEMKYIIKLNDGNFVEQFFKTSVLLTGNINRAGKYTKAIANKRLENLNLKGDLITAN